MLVEVDGHKTAPSGTHCEVCVAVSRPLNGNGNCLCWRLSLRYKRLYVGYICVSAGGDVSIELRRRLLLIRELGLLVADEVVVMLVVYLAVQY